jgi:hypothetical protein
MVVDRDLLVRLAVVPDQDPLLGGQPEVHGEDGTLRGRRR